MIRFYKKNFIYKIYLWLPIIILFISVLNEFDELIYLLIGQLIKLHKRGIARQQTKQLVMEVLALRPSIYQRKESLMMTKKIFVIGSQEIIFLNLFFQWKKELHVIRLQMNFSKI